MAARISFAFLLLYGLGMKIDHILLDMDGVVVHHFIALGRAAGIEVSRDNWPLGKDGIKAITGLDKATFDSMVINGGADLWASMPAFPWFSSFFKALENIAPVYYLSSPEYGAGCVAGKVTWIEKQHGPSFNRFILTTHKTLLARPTAVLIDDTQKNVDQFIAAGGQGILFQQPWNGHTTPDPDLTCLAALAQITI